MQILKLLDQHLLDLAWSLWTELGVAGVFRRHQNTLILVEELVLLTSVLSEIDPRLRDEAMDWCARYHHFISVSRLKSILEDYEGLIEEPFSQFSSTLNAIAKLNWPIFVEKTPLKLFLSQKSVLRPHASAALLNIRARGIFGIGSRADLITFFLVHAEKDFSITELTETGYSKRSLAEILEDFHFCKLFNQFTQGNQQRYRLNKDSPLFEMLKPIPKHTKSWRLIFKVLLTLRDCLKRTKDFSESSKVVEIVNCMAQLKPSLQKLDLNFPIFTDDFSLYLQSFNQTLLDWVSFLEREH